MILDDTDPRYWPSQLQAIFAAIGVAMGDGRLSPETLESVQLPDSQFSISHISGNSVSQKTGYYEITMRGGRWAFRQDKLQILARAAVTQSSGSPNRPVETDKDFESEIEMTPAEIDAALAKLEKLGHDQSGWQALYRDPATGMFWETTYPRSEMHGGGPLQLSEITPSNAATKYPGLVQVKPAMVVELDAGGCRTPLEFAEALKAVLGSPEWHGDLPICFVDSMIIFSEGINKLKPPYVIKVLNTSELPQDVLKFARDTSDIVERIRERRLTRTGEDVAVKIEILK